MLGHCFDVAALFVRASATGAALVLAYDEHSQASTCHLGHEIDTVTGLYVVPRFSSYHCHA